MKNLEKKPLAIADLGSNTFHLMIGSVEKGRKNIIFQRREAVGIGLNGMALKEIQPDAMARGIRVLSEFAGDIRRFGLEPADTLVLATSAFRNATNTAQVIKEIELHTGLKPTVISGEEEAAYIFSGVHASGAIQDSRPSLIMDIGGGSVEFILWDGSMEIWKRSFEMGGLRLMERFHQSDPLSMDVRLELEKFLSDELLPLWEVIGAHNSSLALVGSSGSFDTLADLRNAKYPERGPDSVDASFEKLSLDEFSEIFQGTWHLPLAERLALPGMTAYRAKMMAVSLILIGKVLENTGAAEIFVSHYAMKEGALFRESLHV
jgi:exopolyphosphatase/guanosine-5'-triphosphate,3'-diphosphate pyrophosphatase